MHGLVESTPSSGFPYFVHTVLAALPGFEALQAVDLHP